MPKATASDRIDRCVKLLAGHPATVDLLLSSLRKAFDQPNCERFRKVPVDHPTYKRIVGGVGGGTELLFACGYEPMYGHLVLQKWDAEKLKRAISGLERAQTEDTYLKEKERARAEEERVRELAHAREEARMRRAAHAKLVPKEPELSSSGATTSCVQISVQSSNGTKLTSRRFDSEHTLRNLLHYVRSLDSTPIDGRIKLQNVTTAPFAELDLEQCLDRSLYSLDLWPVSHVRVVPVNA